MQKQVTMLAAALGAAAMLSGSALASDQTPKTANGQNAPVQQQQTKHYTVAEGDNLSQIAAGQGLDSWRPLWNANGNIQNPDLIYPGEDLVIPQGQTTDRPLPAGYSSAALDQSYQSAKARVQSRPVTYRAPVRNYAAPVYSGSSGSGLLDRVKQRESGGNYATNTGNGYYGAYQFDLGTWRSNAPAGWQNVLPSAAPPSVQDQAAQTLYGRRGCSPWPNTCF